MTEQDLVPTFPEPVLKVVSWPDPVLDQLGHDPRSLYVERYWLSILGPSCLLLVRKMAAEIERSPEGFEFDTAHWAQELGLGVKGGKNGPFWRSILRACRFGAAQRNGEILAVRRKLPPLTARQIERLPTQLGASHAYWVEQRADTTRRTTVSKWSANRSAPSQPAAEVSEGPSADAA